MGRIDTSSWGTFRLGKLLDIKTNKTIGTGLFNIVNSVAYHGKDITETDDKINGINYVTRSKFNNGVKCKVIKSPNYIINPKGTISFGAENADFFYQKEEYITGNKMYYIDTSALSEYACAFLKSVLEATFTANYSFSDGMIPARIYNEIIKLPIDAKGDPNWTYMENYMKAIEASVSNSLSKLALANRYKKTKTDISNWRKYTILQLFDVLKGKPKIATSEIVDNGTVPVYSSTTDNGGILGYTTKTAEYKTSDKTPYYLIFGDHTKSMFIVDTDFNIMDNVKVLLPKVFNKYAIMFICTAWAASIPNLGYARHWSVAQKTEFFLPEKNGILDWTYMENYMKSLETKVKNTLDKFI